MFKNDKVYKNIPVLDIAKNKSVLMSGTADIRPCKKCNVIRVLFEIMQCEMVFEGSALQDPFSHSILIWSQ